jgi:hypothetical protein
VGFPAGDVYHTTLGGAMYTDRWQIGFWQSVTGMTTIPSATQMNTDAASTGAFFSSDVWNSGAGQSLKPLNAASVNFDIVRNAMYRNGVLVQTGLANIAPVVGTGTTAHSASTALVCTLRTGQAGRSFRGRIYLPATACPVSGSNMQTSVTLSVLIVNLKTFFDHMNVNDINFPGTPTLRVGVLSQVLSTIAPVTTLSVDSKLDVIRRRQDKIGAAATASATLA